MFNNRRLKLFNLNLISLTISDLGIVSMFPLKIDACFHRTWRPSMFSKYNFLYFVKYFSFILHKLKNFITSSNLIVLGIMFERKKN